MANVYGNQVFVNTGGMCFGEIYCADNTDAVTLNSAAKVQITDFDANGPANNTTPDHTNDHITITKAGMYLAIVTLSVKNNAAQSHVVTFSIWKNNGAAEFANTHVHRTLTGGSTDIGSLSISAIIDLAATDTIELWANTDAAADRSVTVVDCSLSLLQVGGT